jgi:hypothetical protein
MMTMAMASAVQRECFQLIQDYLQVSDLRYQVRDDIDAVELYFSDTPRVIIWTFLLGDDPFVCVRSYLVTGAGQGEELYLRLLRRNLDLVLGKVCIDPDGDILVEHVLGGVDLDRSELVDTVMAVGLAGAEVRKEVLAGYGGRAMT